MNNSNNKAFYPLIGSVLVVIGLFLGIYLSKDRSNNESVFIGKYGEKLSNIIQVIDQEYVDTVDSKELFEKSIGQLLHDLDPHSIYISAEDLKGMNEGIKGQYGGVGIRFTIFDDTLNVVNIIEGSPSSKVGIQKFDQILKVDTIKIAHVGLTNERVQELLKGEAGTPVKITILRKGKTLEKEIVRGIVPINSILASYMVTKDIGYIRLSQFSMQSSKEFYLAAIDLKKQGMKKLIFDLRYNGGGVLSGAVDIIDAFLEKGKVIVSTKGKNSPERIIYSENTPFLGDIDVAVLINSSSASASEIVSGAIQDNDRGVIIGRRSFGKGLVQQDFPLKDGSDLRLTIARYYTPTGRCIQKPYTAGYHQYIMDEVNRYEDGEMYNRDSSLMVDSLKYTTPEGKTVYGGGGIMPDVFVPLDTTGSSVYLRKLQYANAFNEFSYQYARFHKLNQYRNVKEFSARFTVSQQILKDFIAFATEKSAIPYDNKGFNHSLERIKTNIKTEIARQIWIEEGAYYIMNQTDKEFNKAVEELEQ